MKHATAASLDQIEQLLATLRTIPGLRERVRGVFYARAKAFLHFHEDHISNLFGIGRCDEWPFVGIEIFELNDRSVR